MGDVKDFLAKQDVFIPRVLGKKVKLLHFMCGIKKGSIVKITSVSFNVQKPHIIISGNTSKKGFSFHSEEFEFLEIVK